MLYEFDKKYTFSHQKVSCQKLTYPNFITLLRPGWSRRWMQCVKSHFRATTDMWSSQGMMPNMGFIVHHIDDDWRLHSHNLGTRFVTESHTGNILGQAMLKTPSDWRLSPNNQDCVLRQTRNLLKQGVFLIIKLRKTSLLLKDFFFWETMLKNMVTSFLKCVLHS